MPKLLAVLVILLMFSGCTSTPDIAYQNISYPPLKVPSTAYLGERLLMQGKGFRTDVLEVDKITGKYAEIDNATFCRYGPKSTEFFSFDRRAIRFINFVGGIRSFGSVVSYKKSDNEICIDDFWSGCFDSSFGSYTYKPDSICSKPSAIQQIIEYNGKAGNILNFTYREFTRDRISAPFTTNFTMDLNEGNVVNYKGARLEIEKATNQEISYTVSKNFTKY
ncbi:hypothetical protein [Nitrospira sp. M1]